jgi:hypothetical protein
LAAIFLLLAANSALIFADRTVFASSRRGGPLTPIEWIYPGVVAFYLFLAGAFCGAAIVLWFQRRHAGSRAGQLSRHHKCRQATGTLGGILRVAGSYGQHARVGTSTLAVEI